MTDERFAEIKRCMESTIHGPMIDELVQEVERLRESILRQGKNK